MHTKVIQAPAEDTVALFDNNPVIFLAGPIQGAPNWQERAVSELTSACADIDNSHTLTIANPRRATMFHGEFGLEMYQQQVRWERLWLRRAAVRGLIVFWLAKEEQHRCDRAYAQTTRFELGEAFGRYIEQDTPHCSPPFFIGMEEGFTGTKYVRYMMENYIYKHTGIYPNLSELCAAAVAHVINRR